MSLFLSFNSCLFNETDKQGHRGARKRVCEGVRYSGPMGRGDVLYKDARKDPEQQRGEGLYKGIIDVKHIKGKGCA